MDIVDSKTRSRMMAGIKCKNTKPEVIVRHELFSRGFRYRLNVKQLPGKPDIVLKKYNAAILVNGCFWHGHECKLFKLPKTRTEFWKNKIDGNRRRDQRVISDLTNLGLRVCTIWECSLRDMKKNDMNRVMNRLTRWIEGKSKKIEIP